jgi:hypothetical protein
VDDDPLTTPARLFHELRGFGPGRRCARAQDSAPNGEPLTTVNPVTLTYDSLVDGTLPADDPANRRSVVVADNRGLQQGASDNGYVLIVNATDFTAGNLTILNYCNVDYQYPGDPSKNLTARSAVITQAVALQASGDKHVYDNVALLSRLDTMFLLTSRSYSRTSSSKAPPMSSAAARSARGKTRRSIFRPIGRDVGRQRRLHQLEVHRQHGDGVLQTDGPRGGADQLRDAGAARARRLGARGRAAAP